MNNKNEIMRILIGMEARLKNIETTIDNQTYAINKLKKFIEDFTRNPRKI